VSGFKNLEDSKSARPDQRNIFSLPIHVSRRKLPVWRKRFGPRPDTPSLPTGALHQTFFMFFFPARRMGGDFRRPEIFRASAPTYRSSNFH